MPKLSAVVPAEVAAKLKEQARAEDRSVGSIIRLLLAAHVATLSSANGDGR